MSKENFFPSKANYSKQYNTLSCQKQILTLGNVNTFPESVGESNYHYLRGVGGVQHEVAESETL